MKGEAYEIVDFDLLELEPAKREAFLRKQWEARNSRRVIDAMTEYLREVHPWQVFSTLTFAPKARWRLDVAADRAPRMIQESEGKPQTSEQFVQRVVCRFVQILNERMWGRRYYRRSERVKLFVPWEPQKWGALHAHPLIGGMPVGGEWNADDELGVVRAGEWRFQDVHDAWREAQMDFGLQPGYAWLKPYEPGRVDGYVAKYVTKDLKGDGWTFFGFECESNNRG